jgi:hypothetical protein
MSLPLGGPICSVMQSMRYTKRGIKVNGVDRESLEFWRGGSWVPCWSPARMGPIPRSFKSPRHPCVPCIDHIVHLTVGAPSPRCARRYYGHAKVW